MGDAIHNLRTALDHLAYAVANHKGLPPNELHAVSFPSRVSKIEFDSTIAQNVTAGTRRNVRMHDAAGGHTVDQHVGKPDSWLRARLAVSPKLDAALTFTNEAAANRAQGAFVNKNSAQIKEWLADPDGGPTLSMDYDTGKPVGRVLKRGAATSNMTTKANLVLSRDKSPLGWHFLTAYPVKSVYMAAKDLYPQLDSFIQGYFHQNWIDVVAKRGETEEEDYIINDVLKDGSRRHLTLLRDNIANLLATDASEEVLRQMIKVEFRGNIDPTLDGYTWRAWLEHLRNCINEHLKFSLK